MIMVCKKVLHRDFIGKRKKDFFIYKGCKFDVKIAFELKWFS